MEIEMESGSSRSSSALLFLDPSIWRRADM